MWPVYLGSVTSAPFRWPPAINNGRCPQLITTANRVVPNRSSSSDCPGRGSWQAIHYGQRSCRRCEAGPSLSLDPAGVGFAGWAGQRCVEERALGQANWVRGFVWDLRRADTAQHRELRASDCRGSVTNSRHSKMPPKTSLNDCFLECSPTITSILSRACWRITVGQAFAALCVWLQPLQFCWQPVNKSEKLVTKTQFSIQSITNRQAALTGLALTVNRDKDIGSNMQKFILTGVLCFTQARTHRFLLPDYRAFVFFCVVCCNFSEYTVGY